MGSAGPRYLSDLPEIQEEALWHHARELAELLAREIPAIPCTSPILLSGDWGSGKTTILKAIERELAKSGGQDEVPHTVFFEAWRYEMGGLLLPALLRVVWESLPSRKRPSPSLRDKLWHCAIVASVGMAGTLAKTAGGPAVPLMDALVALRQDEKQGSMGARYKPPEDATKTLQESFHALIRGRWETDRPLVVLIDDLDRCAPLGAVQLLDSIRHLIHSAAPLANAEPDDLPCRFLVALDRTVLAGAIAQKFSASASYDGNRYLKKIFPITFDLPAPPESEVHRFVRSFLDPDSDLRGDSLDALTTSLAEPLFANPRLMKRCINRFRLIRTFEAGDSTVEHVTSSEQEGLAEDHLTVLARWIAATELWPGLRDLLVRKTDEVWSKALADGSSSPMEEDPDLAPLLREVGALDWLRRNLGHGRSARLRDFRLAEARLRRWGI